MMDTIVGGRACTQIQQSHYPGERGMIKMRGEAIQNCYNIAKVGIVKLGIHFSGFQDSMIGRCCKLTSFMVLAKSSGALKVEKSFEDGLNRSFFTGTWYHFLLVRYLVWYGRPTTRFRFRFSLP
jgi:hypothetical protein